MKKSVILAVAAGLLVTASALADAFPRRRYLVATRKPISGRQLAIRGEGSRPIRPFKAVHGFAADLSPRELVALYDSEDVLFIEPDPSRHLFSEGPMAFGTQAAATTQSIPFGIDMVNAPQLWPLSRGERIRVAVIDTGLDKDHADLASRYRGGYDFINDDDDPQDDHGHGTHVAGTIAAANNEIGVVGIAPEIDLYAAKVLDQDGYGSGRDVIAAVDWAIEQRIHVINLSLGDSESSVLEEQAFQRASDAGIIAVAASGNGYSGVEILAFPAGYRTVLSVGAIKQDSQIATFSQRGTGLKLVGPGVGVLSTFSTQATSEVEITIGTRKIRGTRMTFSPNRVAQGAYVDCGIGRMADFPASVRGKIALIERGGDLTFAVKSANAKNAGAIAVIIYNNVAGTFSGTLGESDSWLPTYGIARTDGEFLLSAASPISMNILRGTVEYKTLQGTSMASPHVAGVTALVWSLAPRATAQQVQNALFTTAHDLGANGWDATYGYGLVDALAAGKQLAPERFNPQPNTPKRRGARR